MACAAFATNAHVCRRPHYPALATDLWTEWLVPYLMKHGSKLDPSPSIKYSPPETLVDYWLYSF